MQRCARSGAPGTRADPSHVEEALRAATRDTRLSAPARAYAATLSALGRARRGDLKAGA
ncbi:MAG: hypothetical protein WDO74_33350 [Pseudomonadota bacterium]